MANKAAGNGVVEAAERFYRHVGNATIRVNREVPFQGRPTCSIRAAGEGGLAAMRAATGDLR